MSEPGGLKKNFLKRKLKGNRANRKPVLKSPDNFRSILVVADSDKSYLENTIHQLFRLAKINFLFPRKEKEDKTDSNRFSYHPSDFNLTGIIKNDKLNKLIQTEFDLVLDLSKNGLIETFLIEQINPSFLIGKLNQKESYLHDLIIEDDENETTFLEKINTQIILLSQNGTE